MTILQRADSASPAPWTCPFCPLLCDTFTAAPAARDALLGLAGSDCPRAAAALARFSAAPPVASPTIGGAPCNLDNALAGAAQLLAASRQPLFAGLGTDLAGARALYPLACATGAVSDAAQGAALMHGLNAMQDRGTFTTTFAEVRTRADLIVCIGGWPGTNFPELFARFGIGEAGTPARRIVVIGGDATTLPRDVNGVAVEALPTEGDLFDSVAMLAAHVAARPLPPHADGAVLGALAASLRAARYAVIVWQALPLPAHGALIVEAINRVVDSLNRSTRAAAFPLGGADGSATVNQVVAWLSGLPLRSRAGPLGLEHEPLRFDAARLLADGAVDALLWIASFGTEPLPPAIITTMALPMVVLGHPSWPERMTLPAGDRVVYNQRNNSHHAPYMMKTIRAISSRR